MEAIASQCKICFKSITCSESIVIDKILSEIFEILFIKVELTSSPTVICSGCKESLLEAFLFKSKCLQTEDSLMPYLFKDKIKSLKVVANKIKNEESTLDDTELCRLCKNFVFGNILINLQTMLEFNGMKDFFIEYMPEIDLEVIEESIICGSCQRCFINFHNFLLSTKSNLEIKKLEDVKEEFSIEVEDHELIKEETGLSLNKYRWNCEKCIFQTNEWIVFKQHMAKSHLEKLGPPLYKCSECNFQVSHKVRYERHVLTHNNNENIKTFKCNLCSYITIRKDALKDHMLVHDDKGKYKCSHCGLFLKTSKTLSRHKLCKHGNKYTKAETFKCHLCNYSSLRKDSVQRHMLKHKNCSETEFFYCHQCHYKAIYKSSLAVHMLVHNNSEESKIYACKQCKYKTNRKNTFEQHMCTHKHKNNINKNKI